MDFIEGLLRSEGKDSILMVVDRLMKYNHFLGLNHPYSVVHVARTFMANIYKLHGNPNNIVSNSDPFFLSTF